MPPKYNLALIPLTKRRALVQLSQKLAPIADRYMLGTSSHPHITLCQFFTDETSIENIWQETLDALPATSLLLSFEEWSFTTSNNAIFWIALMPDQRDLLTRMHKTVARIVNVPEKNNYDPHLTLINTKNKNAHEEMHEMEKEYETIQDEFILALGECDDAGQITRLVYVQW